MGGRTSSLNAQLALTIGLLAGVPNLAFALLVLLPQVGGAGALAPGAWGLLALWTTLVIAGSALIGSLLTRSILRPLNDAAALLRDMAESAGTGTVRTLALEPGDPHEVDTLKRAFNRLLRRVETEQGRRNAFMATIAHDLKTPLVATGTMLALIRDRDELSRDDRVELVSALERENRTLLELVQTLLDAYRFEQRAVPLAREPVDLAALVRTVRDRVAPLAAERGVAIDLEGAARAEVDRRALERALTNLVSNAARYARSRIVVQIYSGMVRVADDGPGLPEPLERLAEPFTSRRIDIDGQSYTAGSGGLGLFIARRILEAHGGRLVCERSDRRGTALLAYIGAGGAGTGAAGSAGVAPVDG